jgi:hypothetical protein
MIRNFIDFKDSFPAVHCDQKLLFLCQAWERCRIGSTTGCKEQGMLFWWRYTPSKDVHDVQHSVQTGLYEGQKTWGKTTLFPHMIPNVSNC